MFSKELLLENAPSAEGSIAGAGSGCPLPGGQVTLEQSWPGWLLPPPSRAWQGFPCEFHVPGVVGVDCLDEEATFLYRMEVIRGVSGCRQGIHLSTPHSLMAVGVGEVRFSSFTDKKHLTWGSSGFLCDAMGQVRMEGKGGRNVYFLLMRDV